MVHKEGENMPAGESKKMRILMEFDCEEEVDLDCLRRTLICLHKVCKYDKKIVLRSLAVSTGKCPACGQPIL